MGERTYRAEAEPDGAFWRIRVPGLARTTQARDRDEIEPMARDLIAIMGDVPADSFRLDLTVMEGPADG